jgi:hypothetical protein
VRALAAAAAVVVLALTGCTPQMPGIDQISSIAFSPGPAPTSPDDGTIQDDPHQVAAFVELLHEHGVDPRTYVADGGCPDERVMRADLQYGDTGQDAGMVIPSCGAAADSFEAEATALLIAWSAELSPGTAP